MKFLKRCKNEMRSLWFDCKTDLLVNRQAHSKFFSIIFAASTFINTMAIAMADTGIKDFGKVVFGKLTEFYQAAFPIITILAAIMAAIAFAMRMNSNQQKAAQATSWLVRIIIAYVGINCIGLLFSVINGVTSGHRWNETDFDKLYTDSIDPTPTPK